MPKFLVYGKTPCPKCDATKRRMTKKGLEFEYLMLEDHPDVLERAKADGAVSAPYVVAPDGRTWSDFRPDLIDLYAPSSPRG